MTELMPRNTELPAPADWATMLSMAEQLVASGLLPPHIKTPAAAVAIIQRGRELGIPPMYALNNIVYIQGKATTNSELMLALILRDHGDMAMVFTRTDTEECQITYRRRGWPQAQTYSFTMEDAKRAGLLSNKVWQQYPQAMLRARCISSVARMAFPDSVAGMYTPEEMGAQVEIDREGGYTIVDPEDWAPSQSVPASGSGVISANTGLELPAVGRQIPQEGSSTAEKVTAAIDSARSALTVEHLRWAYRRAQQLGVLEQVEVQAAISAARHRLGVPEQLGEEVESPAGQLQLTP